MVAGVNLKVIKILYEKPTTILCITKALMRKTNKFKFKSKKNKMWKQKARRTHKCM